MGLLQFGEGFVKALYLGSAPVTQLYLGELLVWTVEDGQLDVFTEPGAFTYDIPSWATHVDVVLLGGGASGEGGNSALYRGTGGGHGQWKAATLVRGVDIEFGTTQITGTVGDVAGPVPGATPPVSGNATSAAATGWGGLTANGGTVATGNLGTAGQSPGDFEFNGEVYGGGLGGGWPGGWATPPGAGGGGGQGWLVGGGGGGQGARGQAWFRAYLVSG